MTKSISDRKKRGIGGGIILFASTGILLFGFIFSPFVRSANDPDENGLSSEDDAIFSWVTPEKEREAAVRPFNPLEAGNVNPNGGNGGTENSLSNSPSGTGTTEFQMIPPGPEPVTTSLNALENSWGRFAPGSWVRMRKTVTINSKRLMRTVTEIKQTLKEVQEDAFVLQREITVLTGAQSLTKKPETIAYNFYNLALDPQMTETELDPDNILVSLKAVPCQVREFRKMTTLRREETRIWYSPVLFPYVFRQESNIFTLPTEDDPNERLFRQSETEISMKSPNFRFGNVKRWATRTIESDEAGNQIKQITTLHSNQVPGGVLGEVTIEKNLNGTIASRSETRLLDYYVSPR